GPTPGKPGRSVATPEGPACGVQGRATVSAAIRTRIRSSVYIGRRDARHDRAVLSDERLGRWCESSLGSPIVATLFERGNLSRVLGVRLADRQEVVIKIRPWQDRLRPALQSSGTSQRLDIPVQSRLATWIEWTGGL